jgi:hypothetical protein
MSIQPNLTALPVVSQISIVPKVISQVSEAEAIFEQWRSGFDFEEALLARNMLVRINKEKLLRHWATDAITEGWTPARLIDWFEVRLQNHREIVIRENALRNIFRFMVGGISVIRFIDDDEKFRLGRLALDFFEAVGDTLEAFLAQLRTAHKEYRQVEEEWQKRFSRECKIGATIRRLIGDYAYNRLPFEDQKSYGKRLYDLDLAIEAGQQELDLSPYADLTWIGEYVSTRQAEVETEQRHQANYRLWRTWWDGLSPGRRAKIEDFTTLTQRQQWKISPEQSEWDTGEWLEENQEYYGDFLAALHRFSTTNNIFVNSKGKPLPESVRTVFLDFLDALNRAELWTIHYAYRFASKRTGLSPKICRQAIQKLHRAGFIHYEGGGRGEIQIDDNGVTKGDDPARFSIGISIYEPFRNSSELASGDLPTEIPDREEKFTWSKLGPSARMVYYKLSEEPGNISEIAARTGKDWETIQRAIRALKSDGLIRRRAWKWYLA